MAEEPSSRVRETFQKFWTKDKTESLLSILEDQAENGEIQHDKVAQVLSRRLNLQTDLEADQIIDRISIMVANFKREVEKEEKTGTPSQWRWKQQLHDLIEKLQRNAEPSSDDEEDDDPPPPPPKKSAYAIDKKLSGNPTAVIVTNDRKDGARKTPPKDLTPPTVKIEPSPISKGITVSKSETQKTARPEIGNNVTKDNSPINITYNERRGRMPDLHVEVLLDCYKYVLQNRMLSSGRLGKGSFQEVADEMNKRCKMNEDNFYEREQLAAKLQNLKTQFRNRKIAVDEGRESASAWKWYNIMDDLSQAESLLRESFDATNKLHANYSNSPILTINDDDEDENQNDNSRKHFSISGIPDKRQKRELTRVEIEQSIGDLALLIGAKNGDGVTDDEEVPNHPVNRDLTNLRSMACQLLTGFSAIINYVNTPPDS